MIDKFSLIPVKTRVTWYHNTTHYKTIFILFLKLKYKLELSDADNYSSVSNRARFPPDFDLVYDHRRR